MMLLELTTDVQLNVSDLSIRLLYVYVKFELEC